MKLIDNFLNSITMYRLVLYTLIVFLLVALGLSYFNLLPFSPMSLVISTALLLAVGIITNLIFSYVFKAPANYESIYISALILALIITPIQNTHGLPFIFWAACWASASKFIFAIRKKHIFNPTALAVFLTSVFINQSASWWIGTAVMLPAVVIGGFLIIRKIKRFKMVLSFLIGVVATIIGFSLLKGNDSFITLQKAFLDSPIIFFAVIMLTEPLTSPPALKLQMFYGLLVGVLFNPSIQIFSTYTTPESALLIGNIFSYLVSPKDKLILKLKEKNIISRDIYDFVFTSSKKPAFKSGQYMEWTLPPKGADSRGNRRYLTVASSPTEADMRIGIRMSEKPSSFKKTLASLSPGDQIVASQLSGEFTLPKNKGLKIALMAGGIGITPFRSMAKYLIDEQERRDVVLLYSAKNAQDLVYREIFEQAGNIGLKPFYFLTDTQGYIDQEKIKNVIPDFKDRLFYLSGPKSMVDSFEEILSDLKVPKNHIKTDFFPGF